MRETALDRRAAESGFAPPAPVTALPALLVLLAGCAALQRSEPQEQTIRHPFYGLDEAQPADMIVLPVENASAEEDLPVDIIRREVYGGLADLLYSPVDLNFVDVRRAEAGFAPDGLASADGLDAGALLRVVVREWDSSLLGTHGVIRAKLVAEVLDGADPEGDPLWGVTLERRIKLAYDQVRLDRQALYQQAAVVLGEEVLEALPARDPVPVELR
jgi:hypothetical protein